MNWDVYVLQADDNEEDNRTITRMTAGDDPPDTDVDGYHWLQIGFNLNDVAMQALFDQYPHAARARC